MRFPALLLLLGVAVALQYTLTVNAKDTQCFYDQLPYQTKLNVELTPASATTAVFTITQIPHEEGERTKAIYETQFSNFNTIRVSKFAPATAYYSFCIYNPEAQPFKTTMKLQTGLDLMELSVLPNLDDNAQLDEQIRLLEEQHENLLESLREVESSKLATQELLNLMSTKSIWFGVLGLAMVIAVNFGYHFEVKRTLRERKLI